MTYILKIGLLIIFILSFSCCGKNTEKKNPDLKGNWWGKNGTFISSFSYDGSTGEFSHSDNNTSHHMEGRVRVIGHKMHVGLGTLTIIQFPTKLEYPRVDTPYFWNGSKFAIANWEMKVSETILYRPRSSHLYK